MKNINIFFEKKPLKMICLGFSSGASNITGFFNPFGLAR